MFLLLFINLGVIAGAAGCTEWVVKVEGGEAVARALATEFNFTFVAQVKGFTSDTFRVLIAATPPTKRRDINNSQDHRVVWAEQQTRRKRRRVLSTYSNEAPRRPYTMGSSSFLFNDELWDKQWYLQDTRMEGGGLLPRLDLGVVPVYSGIGLTGRGVRVVVLDDGLEHTHQDIAPNYDAEISYDLNDDDGDPRPRYDGPLPNSHGTRCAGEIAMAANNGKCGVGVAFNANIGGIRMLDGEDGSTMDRIEAEALNFALDKVDIYSASWGPTDDGTTVEGPGTLALEAFERGVTRGRGGKGALYVWAAGNGGSNRDDCNCDGYTSSIYTVAVGSASQHGRFPWYGERCASTLVSTYSSGAYSDQMIATTDLHNKCTVKHTGTSAAAPLAAGIIALALEVNPSLTWRDVQHLIVWTSDVEPLADNLGWQRNSAGFRTNPRFGFGLMNALSLTVAAANWTLVPKWTHQQVTSSDTKTALSGTRSALVYFHVTLGHVRFLEHVQLKLSIEYPVRGVLQLFLTSPTGTRVELLSARPKDKSSEGFREWTFMSVHTWGEQPQGLWLLEASDSSGAAENKGWVFGACQLILHGTKQQPYHYQRSIGAGDEWAAAVARRDEFDDGVN